MLTTEKEFIPPYYPSREIPSFGDLVTRYLETRDFYDLPESVKIDANLYVDAHEPERLILFCRPMRLVIYPSDIWAVYGKSERTARRLLQTIREEKGLPRNAPVTIRDFCEHTKFPYDIMHDFIMES